MCFQITQRDGSCLNSQDQALLWRDFFAFPVSLCRCLRFLKTTMCCLGCPVWHICFTWKVIIVIQTPKCGISLGKMIQKTYSIKHYSWHAMPNALKGLKTSCPPRSFPPSLADAPTFFFLLSAKPVTLMSCVQSSQGPSGFHQGLRPSWYSAAFDVVPSLAPCGQTLALAS